MPLPRGLEVSITLDLAPGCGVNVNSKCGKLAASALVDHAEISAEAASAEFTVSCPGYRDGCQAQVSGEILDQSGEVLCRLPLVPPQEP